MWGKRTTSRVCTWLRQRQPLELLRAQLPRLHRFLFLFLPLPSFCHFCFFSLRTSFNFYFRLPSSVTFSGDFFVAVGVHDFTAVICFDIDDTGFSRAATALNPILHRAILRKPLVCVKPLVLDAGYHVFLLFYRVSGA